MIRKNKKKGERESGTGQYSPWSPLLLVRYILLQLPIVGLLVIVYLAAGTYDLFSPTPVLVLLIGWIVKDIVLYPFVWRSYIPRSKDKSDSMIGKRGHAISRLDPAGEVRIGSERWKAENISEARVIENNSPVKVADVESLTLYVVRDHDSGKEER